MTTDTNISAFQPQVGDRCHYRLYTDIKPCTVTKRTAKRVTVRLDTAVLVQAPEMVAGGFAGVVTKPAVWQCVEDLQGVELQFALRKDGRWCRVGVTRCYGYELGEGWLNYFDYGF